MKHLTNLKRNNHIKKINTKKMNGEIKKINWLNIANVQYNNLKELRKNYQKLIKNDKEFNDIEQKWVDKNLKVIIDFMGDIDVWNYIISGVVVYGFDGSKASTRNKPVFNHPIAVFTGTHWNSRKANEINWFEPYEDYQILGTNQFCQTFAMMYLADKLPAINMDKYNFTKYYTYTNEALKFIEEVINSYPSSTLKERRAIKECIKYPNICLNSIEFP